MRKKVAVLIALAVLFGGAVAFGAAWFNHQHKVAKTQAVNPPVIQKALIKYGINLSDFTVMNHVVKPNEFFADILSQYNVTKQTINNLASQSKEIFNLNKLKAGSNCTFLCEKNNAAVVPKKLIIEENKVDYIVFDLADSLSVKRGQNKVDHQHREISGIINSSLYETLERNNLNPILAIRLSEIFAWTVDFYKIQPGDKFKMMYDEDFVNGQSVNIGQINACVFNSGGKDFYAFYYQKPGSTDGEYYDENGNSMRKQFLKAPVKFSRISSGYSLNRFHPVTKEWKAHLGTDYAAPMGTPILATADGVIEDACSTCT
jgi:murein DD-endopeptidase MepM/ murein hydrolase activator NlpD